jgi:hypothetical protein
MDLLLEMLRDEPNGVIGAVAAALAAKIVLLRGLWCDEVRIARMRHTRERRPQA